mmetsp:Transcript_118/g.282  ORF Transcript_118/g.282 Transcript_118/m.282 type:complete len:266 (-) Transcript_118:151-948(-)|eukprot:CAMPEP_0181110906 /NCGR_PEP_ID=MMETSP1071-20121207/18972_1 /TAXON_ID=35127 /ORGANISM="Thalassiosira sp., Strain NH16" /LENGTH=265 /DNA_ID=CAMNT_0023194725 /DNA_START=92 /DNA_END=889 /DNA_ORIENTATION=-
MAFPGRWWHKPEAQDAFWLSWISLICTIVAAIGGLVGFSKTESTLILAFGLENIVDFTSSAVVLWRFYCPHGCDEAKLAKLQKREERAGVAISIVIGILGLFVFSIGIVDVLKRDKDTDLGLLFSISFVSIIVFGTLTILKFKYANDLDSESLYKDGICSLIGTCLSGSLLLTTAIIDRAPKAWVLDPIVSLLIGISATVYGFRVVIKMVQSGVPIFHRDWWITKEDTNTKHDLNQELPDLEKNGNGDYEGGQATEEKRAEHEVV